MHVTDIWGHVGYLVLFVGQLFITQKVRIGFLIRFFGELIWLGVGIAIGMSSIWIWSIVFAIVELVGWIRWGQRSKNDRSVREVDAGQG